MDRKKCRRQSVVYEELPKKKSKKKLSKSHHSEIEMESRKTGVKKLISFDGIRSKRLKNTKKSSKYTTIVLN